MTLPIRPCIGCQQADDHPRHVVILADQTEVPWHMDCHVLTTGCELCAQQLAGADGATGAALRDHLVGLTTKDG